MNSLGRIFRLIISAKATKMHRAVIDGCPRGLALEESDIHQTLTGAGPDRTGVHVAAGERRVENLVGHHEWTYHRAPLCLVIKNEDIDDRNYVELTGPASRARRPPPRQYGGFHDYRGGGIFSGRRTAACVMAER
jgi:chorismate synthase